MGSWDIEKEQNLLIFVHGINGNQGILAQKLLGCGETQTPTP